MEPRDLFISYKTEDKDAAERLCEALERENISCWMAPRDIPPGREWAAAIVHGLQNSKSFVVLLSSHSSEAKQIAREAELADKQNLPIVTFRLEDIEPPPELLYFLGNIQWLDGFGGQFETAARRLAEVIRSNPKVTATLRPPAIAPRKPPTRALALGAAVLLVLTLAWFGLRRSTDKSTEAGTRTAVAEVDKMAEAKKVADRFLDTRDSGHFDAAWDEYSPSFQKRDSRTGWQSVIEKRNASHGGSAGHQFRNCRSSKEDVFVCSYTLLFKDGSNESDELWVVKNDEGGWSIDQGKIR